jgi:DNA invertase Pin-like site-specific DNA recombinase
MINNYNKTPRVWGYARASTSDQVMSPEKQLDLITAKGQKIEGAKWARCRVDVRSATKSRWNDRKRRPEFGKLMDQMEQGDHLILWRLDRLERRMFPMVQALDWLVRRGINIHVLEHGGMQLDLDTAMGRLLVMILAGFSEVFSAQLSETIKAEVRWRKARGIAYSKFPPPGHIRVKRLATNPKGDRKYDKFDVWDDKQCDLIREIAYRFNRGVAMYRIAEDFVRRRERRGDGTLWINPKGHGKTRLRLGLDSLYKAYWWHMERLSRGLDLKDLPCTLEVQEHAQDCMARKQLRASHGRRKFDRIEFD